MQVKEFKLIEDANKLLNKQNSDLGVKPMKVETISKSIEEINTPAKPKIKPVEKKDKVNTKAIGRLIIFSVITLIIIAISVFFFKNYQSGNNIEKIIEKATSSKQPFSHTKFERKEKPALITSGVFQIKAEAEIAKKELSKLAGNALKVVKIDDYYTIRIGPRYNNYENALLVFTELQKYPIKDISIKTKEKKKR